MIIFIGAIMLVVVEGHEVMSQDLTKASPLTESQHRREQVEEGNREDAVVCTQHPRRSTPTNERAIGSEAIHKGRGEEEKLRSFE